MKKILSFALAIIFIAICTLVLTSCIEPEENKANNQDQDLSSAYATPDFTYKEINNGTEYEVSAGFLGANIFSNKTSSDIIIPSNYNGKPVTAIADNGFASHHLITRVIIPDSITVIGKSAFYECSGINSIILGKATTKIGDHAFYNCSSLNSINIPETLTYLGDYAFAKCSNLQSDIIIPDAVTNSLKGTFFRCSKITSVTIGKGVSKIDNNAFSESGIISVIVPGSVKSIENEAFRECKDLISVIIEDGGVTHIAGNLSYTGGAFRDCTKLKTISLGNKLEHIGIYAFKNCSSLETLNFPITLISIGDAAFRNCNGLVSITFKNSPTIIGEHAFEKCSKLKNIDLGNSIKRIRGWAFKDCISITKVTIPQSVEYIGTGSASGPFYGCNKPEIYVKGLSSAPPGWYPQWDYDCGKVFWGQ